METQEQSPGLQETKRIPEQGTVEAHETLAIGELLAFGLIPWPV